MCWRNTKKTVMLANVRPKIKQKFLWLCFTLHLVIGGNCQAKTKLNNTNSKHTGQVKIQVKHLFSLNVAIWSCICIFFCFLYCVWDFGDFCLHSNSRAKMNVSIWVFLHNGSTSQVPSSHSYKKKRKKKTLKNCVLFYEKRLPYLKWYPGADLYIMHY